MENSDVWIVIDSTCARIFHIIHNIHICGCVKMHLFSFLCECVMMKTVRSGKDEQDF